MINTLRALRTFAAGIVFSAMAASPALAQFTVGDPLVSRSNYDGYAGFILVLPYAFPAGALGESVTGVSIFDGYVGRDFTPLIVASTVGGWTITGVGTQRVVAASGLQNYLFGLTQGSDVVTSATRLAFRTSSSGGVIPWDGDGDGNYYAYSPNGVGPASAGAFFPTEAYTDRAYSIEFTATSAVPEPATVVLTASGLLMFGAAGFRRRRA